MSESKSTNGPPQESRPLLPVPFAFVCAGILIMIAAQLWVSVDDFALLYAERGVELPYVVQQLMSNQVLLPFVFLVVGVAVLLGPRVLLPPQRALVEGARQVAMLGTLGFTSYAALLAYSHALVFNELSKSLQQ